MSSILPALIVRVLGLSVGLAVLLLALVRCSAGTTPPLPGEPMAHAALPALAKTRLVSYEAFSDDERYRLESKCIAQGLRPDSTESWVACNGRGRMGWFAGVSDVAPWERGVAP